MVKVGMVSLGCSKNQVDAERLLSMLQGEGYESDFSGERRHHEIYLGDPRRTAPEKLRTVIRHPVRKRA